MAARIIAFTEKGNTLAERIASGLPELQAQLWDKACESREDFAREAFSAGDPLIFIGACGIAVRTVAPFVRDKLTDPPVIVIDELALHVIPILSGHYGGANELAVRLAEFLGSDPVITTATDINKAFSVDVFARENGLSVKDRHGIARVSTKALSGKPVTLSIHGFPPKEPVDVIAGGGTVVLAPDGPVLGVGCRRGTSFEDLKAFASECLGETGLSLKDVTAVASIDIKADEPCILELSKELSVPFLTFTAELLEEAPGEFSSSEFVKERTGVDNVCERAAVLASGCGELILRKHAGKGMTIACALPPGRKIDE